MAHRRATWSATDTARGATRRRHAGRSGTIGHRLILATIVLTGISAPTMAMAAAAVGPEPEARRQADRDRLPKRDRSDGSSQQFDAERLKLTNEDGTFLIFEAPHDANQGVDPADRVASEAAVAERPAGPTGFLAYWNVGDAGGVYVYNRMIHTVADVGDALRALENEFGVDMSALVANNDRAALALELAAQGPAQASWVRSSREQVMYITGLWSPDDFELENDDPAAGGSSVVALDPDHLPAPCGICVRPLGGGDSPTDPYWEAMVRGCDCECGGDPAPPIECSDNDLCTTSYIESNGCTVKCIHRRKKCPCNVCAVNCRCISATGQCTNEPRNCDDGNECTYDRCITMNGAGCQRIPLSDGTPCLDEGDPCLLNVCMRDASGTTSECTHPLKCPDRLCCNGTCCTNPCANDCCIQADNSLTCCYGECMGSTCCPTIVCDGQCCPGSLNSCTSYPMCVNGQCVVGTPSCDDGDPCTVDRCIETGCDVACENLPDAATNGTLCDENDEDPCTVGECENGTCQPVPGNHGAVCPDTDENACTVGECQGGICTPIDDENGGVCEDADGNPCTVGSCFNGACVPGPGNEGGLCADDGNPCTNNVCASGICTYPCKAVCSSTCITSAGAPGWCINCACAPETCEISVSDGLACPGGTAEVTVSGNCGPNCIEEMTWIIESSSPDIVGTAGTLLCSGDSFNAQIAVSPDAAGGSIPLTIRGFNLQASTCEASATLNVYRFHMDPVTSGITPLPINPAIVAPMRYALDDGTIFADSNTFALTSIDPDVDLTTLPVAWTFELLDGTITSASDLLPANDMRSAQVWMETPSSLNFGLAKIGFMLNGQECTSTTTLVRNVKPDIESKKEYIFNVRAHLCTDGLGTSTARTEAEIRTVMADVTKVLSQCGIIVALHTVVVEVVPTHLVDDLNPYLGTFNDHEPFDLFDYNEHETHIDVYFVQQIDGDQTDGLTVSPARGLGFWEAGIAIADHSSDGNLHGQALVRVLAHELAHYLMNHLDGNDDHRTSPANLMYTYADEESRDLDTAQCQEIRSNFGVE